MLTEDIVKQLIEEHELYELDRQAREENPVLVVLSTAQRRAEVLGRPTRTRIEDGIFAFWGWCWPLWRQHARYTDFMRSVRSVLFKNVDSDRATEHAKNFFTAEFLRLGLDELAIIVSRPGALDEWRPGRQIKMFNSFMLPVGFTLPALRGYVFLEF